MDGPWGTKVEEEMVVKSVEEAHWNLLDWFVVVIFIFVWRGGLLSQIIHAGTQPLYDVIVYFYKI